MRANELSSKQREILSGAFKRFRENDHEESNRDYSNRDELEAKLARGEGELNEVDTRLLGCAITTEIPDEDTFDWLYEAMGRPI